jgi:hypothetical protein
MEKAVKLPHSLTDAELKAYADEHLQYEVDMFIWSAGIVAFLASYKDKGHLPWAINNSLLNTFATHARNLIDFLYSRSRKKDYDTDIVIQDYVEPDVLEKILPKISSLLEETLVKANKQVAHLTIERIEYEKAGKEWKFIEVVKHVCQAFASIASHIPDSKISAELKQKLSRTQIEIPIVDVSIINAPDSHPIGVSLSFRQANEIVRSV